MPLLTGLLFNRYTPQSSLARYLGPLPVFDLVLWTVRRIRRQKSLFVAGLAVGACLMLVIFVQSSV
jgi:hypothetical protein